MALPGVNVADVLCAAVPEADCVVAMAAEVPGTVPVPVIDCVLAMEADAVSDVAVGGTEEVAVAVLVSVATVATVSDPVCTPVFVVGEAAAVDCVLVVMVAEAGDADVAIVAEADGGLVAIAVPDDTCAVGDCATELSVVTAAPVGTAAVSVSFAASVVLSGSVSVSTIMVVCEPAVVAVGVRSGSVEVAGPVVAGSTDSVPLSASVVLSVPA